ncbi:hypothetical protein TNIN_111251 [Trichonephila inaurata madagascariensis]|uniref:Uncharacterized protein n=1 Tax=Trichonephila inaurata madagascariensis TaxID=2747483 RepID=A0A8X6XN68_9ARAC|nr:hypothetical protein TNIN_111251 [Trichonephila inaurata madagascariensis]
MHYAQSVSLPSSGSSTPQVSHCYFLQLCHPKVHHYAHWSDAHLTIPRILHEEDLEIQELIQRQTYLKERLNAAVSEFNNLPRCNTSGCSIHETPLNSPTKVNSSEFRALSTVNPIKRKESVDEFISPNSRQTVKKPLLEIPQFNLETQNKFGSLKKNYRYSRNL